MKHTKGEWKYFKANGNHIISNENGCIADVYCNESEDEETELANAKLIAAAPDLLKALMDIKILYMNSHIKEYLSPYKEAWQDVNDAINKATL